MSHSSVKSIGLSLILISLIGLVMPLFSSLMANSTGTIAWLVDLTVHWQWEYLLMLCVGIGLIFRTNRWYLSFFLLAPLPWFTASKPAVMSNAYEFSVSTASVNLYYENHSSEAVRKWLAKTQPDFVALIELSPSMSQDLASWPEYHNKALYPENSPFGIGLISRYPITDTRIERSTDGIPYLVSWLDMPTGKIQVIVFHPMPPLSPAFHLMRNQTMRTIVKKSKETTFPTLIMGDFNATPWSSAFTGLAEHGFTRATGLSPTWPALGAGVLGIPIDHILLSEHWRVIDSGRGKAVGGDHLPVITHLTLTSH